MWRCSSRETFSMPALNPGMVPALTKKSSMKCCVGWAIVASMTMW
jgi:hypothetical protein